MHPHGQPEPDDPTFFPHSTAVPVDPPVPAAQRDPRYGAPKADRPKKMWEIIYGLMAAAEPGQILYWEILGEAIGKDTSEPQGRAIVNQAARRAIKEMELLDKRTARNVRGYGYKVVSDEERLDVARTHQKRAVKEVGLAVRQVTHVDFGKMEPDVRTAFEMTGMALARQHQVMLQLDIRQDKLESVVNSVLAEQQLKTEEMDNVRQRLAALEARTSPPPAPAPPHPAPHHAASPPPAPAQYPPWPHPGYSPAPIPPHAQQS